MTQHRKLLVIDDDPAIFRYLRRGLTREGYDVEAAPGQGMLARMDEWQPDVVLLGLTPTHAVSQIQAIKARSPAPLIGLVPEENTQATIDALDAGADDCITKPFGLEELAAHIRKVLRRDMWRRGETPCFEAADTTDRLYTSPCRSLRSLACVVAAPVPVAKTAVRCRWQSADASGFDTRGLGLRRSWQRCLAAEINSGSTTQDRARSKATGAYSES